MATNEELEQRVKELESLIIAQYDPPTGPEYSFPVPGQPIDQDQFQLLSLGTGNGIIDRGGAQYWLVGWGSDAETNQKNSMVLKTSSNTKKNEALVGGYYHVMTEDKTIHLPPVTEETTYKICITYDPRYIDESGEQAQGAVSLQVYTDELPTTFGRIHVLLWTVTRKPNQLLTDAEVSRHRQRISPVIYVWAEDHKPDPETMLWGSICMVGETGSVYRNVAPSTDGEDTGPRRWTKHQDQDLRELKPDVYTRDDASYVYPGSGAKAGSTRIGQLVVLEGRVARNSGANFVAGEGRTIMTLPSSHRPPTERRFLTKSDGVGGMLRSAIVVVSSNGDVTVWPHQDCSWVGLDGISYTLRY